MTTSDREVVATLGDEIARRIGEPRFKFWFDGNTKFTWEDGLLTVGVPNMFFQDWLQNTFADSVRLAAGEVFGTPVNIRFAIDPELFQASRRAQALASGGRPGPAGESARAAATPARPGAPPGHFEENNSGRAAAARPDQPHPEKDSGAAASTRSSVSALQRSRRWRRLGDFVVGSCNRVAHASALSVVEAPGQGPNPLVLHGPVGTGKTHLLEGIYAGLRKNHPDWRVCYVTSEEFTNRFLQAMHLGKLVAFRKHFRECDALLIDDLHFLARKRATQEEFLHTFDVLQAEGRQLVATCDCHPRLADEFAPELTDRLLGGAIWGLTPPEADTRLDVLRNKSARGDSPVPEDVLRLLAGQLRGNVRELEGALHSVRHFSRVAGRPIDLPMAREALGDLVRHAIRVVQLPDVDQAVCRALKLTAGMLQSKKRAWAVSHPRMLAMFLSRKHTSAAYSEIGDHFGGRNHSTAVAAEKKIRLLLQQDGELTLGERRFRVREVVELVERELLR